METILIYILKATVLLSLSYIGYSCLLAKETFFKFNRAVLLACLIASFTLPLIKVNLPASYIIPASKTIDEQMRMVPIVENIGIATENIDYEIPAAVNPVVYEQSTINIPWLQILIHTYIAGCLINILMLGLSYLRMMRIIRSGEKCTYKDYNYILIDTDIPPFSWKKHIIVSRNESKDLEVILAHEMAHIEHKHYLDTLFTEFMLIFHWFNPFAWKLKQALKDIHEYQADSKVVNWGIEASKYQLLILEKAVGSSSYTLANSFNHSKIKKRITMMLKQKSKNWSRAKLLFLIPAMMCAIYAFAYIDPKSDDEVKENLVEDKEMQVLDEDSRLTHLPVPDEHQKRRASSASTPLQTILGKDTVLIHKPILEKDITRIWLWKEGGSEQEGMDYVAVENAPIYSIFDGTVIEAGKDAQYGNIIKILHANGVETWYASNKENLVKKGDKVSKGQQIAVIGNTMKMTHSYSHNGSNPFLHFEVRVNGESINLHKGIVRKTINGRELPVSSALIYVAKNGEIVYAVDPVEFSKWKRKLQFTPPTITYDK